MSFVFLPWLAVAWRNQPVVLPGRCILLLHIHYHTNISIQYNITKDIHWRMKKLLTGPINGRIETSYLILKESQTFEFFSKAGPLISMPRTTNVNGMPEQTLKYNYTAPLCQYILGYFDNTCAHCSLPIQLKVPICNIFLIDKGEAVIKEISVFNRFSSL